MQENGRRYGANDFHLLQHYSPDMPLPEDLDVSSLTFSKYERYTKCTVWIGLTGMDVVEGTCTWQYEIRFPGQSRYSSIYDIRVGIYKAVHIFIQILLQRCKE